MRKHCIGRHYGGDWEDPDDGPREAEFFRECAACGIQVDLCSDCLSRVFLCERCFQNQRAFGKDQARKIGRRLERRRAAARRRRLRARPKWTTPQLELWAS